MGSILIVDDEPHHLELLQEVFHHQDWDVTLCKSALEALSIIEQKSFNVILTDINMPEISGFHLIDKAMSLQQCQNTSFVAMSGYFDRISAQDSNHFSSIGFIEKPVTIEKFTAELEKLNHQTVA